MISVTPTPSFDTVSIGNTTITSDNAGLIENIGGSKSHILAQKDISSSSPIRTTITPSGIDIGISKDPSFNTIEIGGTVFSTDTNTNQVLVNINNIGPTPILTEYNISTDIQPGSNISIIGDRISTVEDPIFNTSITTPIINIGDITISNNNGILRETSNGNSSLILTQSNISHDSNITIDKTTRGIDVGNTTSIILTQSQLLPSTNIAIDSNTTTGISTISTIDDPVFDTSVSTPSLILTNGTILTSLSLDSSGKIQETTGGTTSVLLRESDLVAGTNITLTNISSGIEISLDSSINITDATLSGALTVDGAGTIYGAAAIDGLLSVQGYTAATTGNILPMVASISSTSPFMIQNYLISVVYSTTVGWSAANASPLLE